MKELNEVMPDSVVECDVKRSVTPSVSLPPRINNELSNHRTRRKKLITKKGSGMVENIESKEHFSSQGFQAQCDLNTEGRPKIIDPPILSTSLMNLDDSGLREMDFIRERKI